MRSLYQNLCLTTGVALVFLLPLPTFADSASKNQEIAERFAKCDTNKDGKLTPAEAKGCMPRVYDNFSFIDSDKKGYITLAQIEKLAR